MRRDTGGPLEYGQLTCSGQVGRAKARLRNSGFRHGSFFCTWALPGTAHGKRLVGSMRVALGGGSVRRAFAIPIH
jgi:hypothetical protein